MRGLLWLFLERVDKGLTRYRRGCKMETVNNKDMKNKLCSKCKRELPLTKKYWSKNKWNKDGWMYQCRECKKMYDRIYSRKYREEHPEWKKADNKKNLGLQKRLIREHENRYPERISANRILQYAVKKGSIKKEPCVVCGNPKSQGHHPDYSKPLEVVWLCAKHHKAIHNPL